MQGAPVLGLTGYVKGHLGERCLGMFTILSVRVEFTCE